MSSENEEAPKNKSEFDLIESGDSDQISDRIFDDTDKTSEYSQVPKVNLSADEDVPECPESEDQKLKSDNILGSSAGESIENTCENKNETSEHDLKTSNAININTRSEQTELEMNTEQIINDFKSKKSKVTLPLKVIESEPLTDAKLVRMHRDTISQDIGSIVKNVSGILSSVGGSLKNAYKTSPQNVVNINKLLTNGTIKSNEKLINESKTIDTNSEIQKDLHSECPDNDQILTVEISEDRVEGLKKQISDCQAEILILRERIKQQSDLMIEKDKSIKDFETKIDLYRKKSDFAEREMSSAVMKYATSERSILEAKADAEKAKRSEKAATAEMNLMNTKLKSAFAEKQRICQLYDDKCHELSEAEKEVTKLKEEVNQLDSKLKWTQGRLKTELDGYKESAAQIERLEQQKNALESQRDSDVAHAQEAYKAKQLENELTECQAALIMSKHEASEAQTKLFKMAAELEQARLALTEKSSEVIDLKAEVERLATSNIQLEQEAAELAALRARAALADTLATNLERESARASRLEAEVSSERARASAAAAREARALQQATELLDQHSSTAAELNDALNKTKALTAEKASLRERLRLLETELTRCQESLSLETESRTKECQLMARKVAELTEELEECKKQLEWEKGENGVLKKKHASALKELNRELQRTLKRCEHLETKVAQHVSPEQTSTRTGSVTSLSSIEAAPPLQSHSDRPDMTIVNGHDRNGDSGEESSQIREPDKQTLIERIVQLQRAGARRSERIDFLEEHNRQLTGELRKKAKLLKHLTANLPTGALAQQCIDDNKKEMARLGGGAMAALWGGHSDGITLELSLEMNKKLQAVLEDTLLKNITLKENMETLGAEIERLKASQSGHQTNR